MTIQNVAALDSSPADRARPSKALPRVAGLDGLRILGAVAVVTTHVGFSSGKASRGEFAGLLSRLDIGVALFFVVSGFLLNLPHMTAHLAGKDRPRAGRYLARRAMRVLPALWVTVALCFVLLPPEGAPRRPLNYLHDALLVQIYHQDHPFLPGLTQMWSLATEAAFYLLLPFLAWWACHGGRDDRWARRAMVRLSGLLLIDVAWFITVAATPSLTGAGIWLPGHLGWFGVGMALSTWYAARQAEVLPRGRLDELAASPGTVWSAALCLFAILTSPIAGAYTLQAPTALEAVTKHVGYAVVAALVVLPVVSPTGVPGHALRVLGSRVAGWLGDISYGIFCYHLLVMELVQRAFGWPFLHGHFGLLWTLTMLGTVPVAAASYHLMERPLMNLLRTGPRREPETPTPQMSQTLPR